MGPTGSVVFPVRHADASSWSTAAAPATRVLRCLGSRRGSATFWRAHNLYSVAHRLATSNHPRSGHHARARAADDSQPQIHRWLSPIGSLGAWVGRASTSWSRSRRAAHGALQETPTNKCRSMSPSTAVTLSIFPRARGPARKPSSQLWKPSKSRSSSPPTPSGCQRTCPRTSPGGC